MRLPGPTVLPLAPETMTPFWRLPTAAVPEAFVPTKLFVIVLPVEFVITSTPLMELPEMTLPGPMVLPLLPPRLTPTPALGIAAAPAALTPIQQPVTTVPNDDPVSVTPSPSL